MSATHLLDINVLMALIWESHEHHDRVMAWRAGKQFALCPITELGFVRISSQPVFNATMADVRQALSNCLANEKPDFIPDDVGVLEGEPAPSSAKTTDFYLANLARKHGLKLASFDTSIGHPAVDVIA